MPSNYKRKKRKEEDKPKEKTRKRTGEKRREEEINNTGQTDQRNHSVVKANGEGLGREEPNWGEDKRRGKAAWEGKRRRRKGRRRRERNKKE